MKDLNFLVKFQGIQNLLNKCNDKDIPISTSVPTYNNDQLIINGLLGMDALSMFNVLELQKIDGQSFFRISNGFVPVGRISYVKIPIDMQIDVSFKETSGSRFECLNVESLPESILGDSRNHPESKIASKRGAKERLSHSNCEVSNINNYVKCHPNSVSSAVIGKSVNFVLRKADTINHYSPLKDVFEESLCEQGLENFFSMESIGIKGNIASYDEAEINKFKQSIELRDNKYYVKLPWKEDILKKVPHNFEIAQALAKKVFKNNNKIGKNSDYVNVFNDQLSTGIIEEIKIDSSFDHRNHIWIPHRPIIRVDPLVNTSKIRPVFNASLKVNGLPSLNEAAFGGVDLLNSLVGLLNYFRTNRIAISGDIKKAFLMIKLKEVQDKNRFSFLLYSDGRFKAYRYSSLIFGFITSPFILNYILQHHAQQCQNLSLKNIMSSKFYVDNFIYTTNEVSDAVKCSLEVSSVMKEGGFQMHEWASNSSQVRDALPDYYESDNNYIKMLGYVFDTKSDSLQIKPINFDPDICTKRGIMSNLYRFFDPLGLMSPLIVNGKFVLREINSCKLNWDDKLPSNILKSWKRFCLDMNSNVNDLSVPRQVMNSDIPVDLVVFVDASSQAYGFCCYAVQGENSHLLLSKVKLAPLVKKSFKVNYARG